MLARAGDAGPAPIPTNDLNIDATDTIVISIGDGVYRECPFAKDSVGAGPRDERVIIVRPDGLYASYQANDGACVCLVGNVEIRADEVNKLTAAIDALLK